MSQIDSSAPSNTILEQAEAVIARRQALFDGNALVLYAGSNIPEAGATRLHSPALSAMPAMGPPDDKEQPGSQAVADLEVALSEVACNVFGAAWADARLPSCSMANLACYAAFGGRGAMLGPSSRDGGFLPGSWRNARYCRHVRYRPAVRRRPAATRRRGRSVRHS